MRLYLDCEWADPEAKHLVSLALIDSREQWKFYAEIDPLPEQPTEFVRDTVYPLLQRGFWAKDKRKFTLGLRNFLHRLKGSKRLILATHETDFALLREALAGFGQDIPGPIPEWTPILVTQGDVLGHMAAYLSHNPDAAGRNHHAMVDANALRWAFEHVIESAPARKPRVRSKFHRGNMTMKDSTVSISQGGWRVYLALDDSGVKWSAPTPAELIAKMDAAGVDRSRLRLDKWLDGPHDHALDPVQVDEFIALLGGDPNPPG